MRGSAVPTTVTSIEDKRVPISSATVVGIGRVVFTRRYDCNRAAGTRLAHAARMPSHIRVAEVAELPPGKGKVLEVGGRSITVYNMEGRFYASATRSLRTERTREPATDCSLPGRSFETH